MKKPSEYPLLDLICTWSVATGQPPEALDRLHFGDVVNELVECAIANEPLLMANEEIHRYYMFCHVQCHIKRLRQFRADGFQWTPGTGPLENVGQHTRH